MKRAAGESGQVSHSPSAHSGDAGLQVEPPRDYLESLRLIVTQAITGSPHIDRAQGFLLQELSRNRFNTERALEVFSIAIDNAVLASLRTMPMGHIFYGDYKGSGFGPREAERLCKQFIERTGAWDQRRPRRFFRFLLGA